MTDQTVTLRITADAKGVVTGVAVAKRELDGIGAESERSGRRASAALVETEKSALSVGNVLANVRRQVIGFFGAFASIQGVRTLAHLADQYSNIRGQLQLVTRSQAELARAESEVFAISQRTSTALASTAELYARLTRSTGEYGISQDRNLRLSETINRTFIVSATAAASQANAVTQLTQAFAGGVLRAEEFNSIIENSPRLAQALADGMGVGVGKLRQLVNDGKVGVKEMVDALENQAAVVEQEFNRMPLTIERAWTRIGNAVLQYVGQGDQASGTSRDIAEAMAWVAENIDRVIRTAVTLAKVLATVYGAKLLYAAAAYTMELVRQTAATTALIAAQSGWAATTASSFKNAQKNIGALGIALNVVGAAVVGWQIGTYLRDEFLFVRLAGIALVEALLVAWERIKQGALLAWEVIKHGFNLFVDAAKRGVAMVIDAIGLLMNAKGDIAGGAVMGQIADNMRAGIEPAESLAEKLGAVNTQANAQVAAIRATMSELVDYEIAADAAGAATKDAGDEAKESAANIVTLGAGLGEASDEGAKFLESLQEQIDTYGLAGTAALRYEANSLALTAAQRDQANALIDQLDEWDKLADVLDKAASALDQLRGMHQGLDDELADMRAELGGASKAQLEFNRTQREAARAYAIAAAAMDPSAAKAYADVIEKAREKLSLQTQIEDAETLQDIFDDMGSGDSFDNLIEKIERVEEAMRKACDPENAKALEEALNKLEFQKAGAQLEQSASAVADGLRSLQSMSEEGSRSYQAMEIAIQAANIAAGIGAIMNQGMGDPYTAFARMAAMAAMVAQMVDGIKNFAGGGFSDTAAQRQERQGTGSVLGNAEAKSESAANSLEIVADATTELVGINRGMLRALIALQDGLAGAAGMLARGAGDAEFGDLAVGQNSFWTAGDTFGILGGKSKITDMGIIIMGGALTEMLESISVGAYQEVQSRSWAFGSTHTREGITDVSDEFGRQFQMIIGSIVDTVREGALALGILPDEIEAALAAYRVEEIRISLKDLSAEEQQAELAAVFSELFDGLAGTIVPFIEQFQQVGEGLGETLVRVATGVQVTQEAMRQLGFQLDETDPERFAQASEGLMALTGGIEGFISGMSSFMGNFATDAHLFEVASTALTSAFEQAGLAVPATRDAMFALMQTFDATTIEGREHIATLLRLADVADQYYNLLEEQVSEANEYLESIGLATGAASAFTRELIDIHANGQRAAEAAHTIAIAQGRQGASAVQLARITQWTADQMAAAWRRLQQQTADIIADLYGGIPGSLDAITARIAELESSFGSGIADVADAGADMFAAWLSGIQSINDYLDSMLLGDLSALSPEEQLAEAQRQLLAMQARALGGDTDALNRLPQMADAFLRLLQGSAASGADYNTGFQWVRDLLQSVVDMPNPHQQSLVPDSIELVPSAELTALYAARDALQAEAEAERRRGLAQQLAENLRDMATIRDVPILDMVAMQNVSLTALAADLGVNLQDLTTRSVEALGGMAATLGLSLGQLTAALGISLTDLAAGLTGLTDRLGIDLAAMTAESTQMLAALAASMGSDLSELATALSLDLGAMTDAQSLVYQALAAEIGSLPAEQSALLLPLLEAITDATREGDPTASIAALEDAINLLAPDIRTQLAPYLAGVFPADALQDLDYLEDLRDIATSQLDMLGLIRDNLKAANTGAGVPSYAVGTGYVPRTGLAMIHEGEAIIPAPFASWMRENGLPTGGGNDERVVVELRAIRERIESLERSNAQGHGQTAATVRDEEGKARVQRDDIQRRAADAGRGRAQ